MADDPITEVLRWSGLTRTRWAAPPRPRDLPRWRIALADAWGRNGTFRHMVPQLRKITHHAYDLEPDWELDTTRRAELWFVRTAMCDLLVSAALDMPSTALTPDMIPDHDGLVVFETPLSGIDADGSGNNVMVGAMLWGPAIWVARPEVMSVGITVYGPLGARPHMLPLGSLVWPLGEPPTCQLENTPEYGGQATYDSMEEDRRRLLALWLLSSQPGLADSERRVQDRSSQRQSQRAGLDANVRVIQLRRSPSAGEVSDEPRSRTYRHRWTVAGHWRNQAFGPAHSLHRPVYINPYLKGNPDHPLLIGERVKVWSR